VVKKFDDMPYLEPFWHINGVCVSDRQMDGRTDILRQHSGKFDTDTRLHVMVRIL